ncbi:glycosyl hydrolase [Nonomuraea phyllanthi]|uniref:glycoside hydrolase family 3 C-terminal domain-containing protein n=1 Tax=Nonomuraea phyllanthi TaxID=2219224 RepID=UPI001293E81D|nr:glycoside hydrolase family 3 C-terminal domain-containing protein [Nonomuraea phyllanthi]QFY10278.1 glycosyl hydrolase [Nonomuraea phyllanthi]
MIPDDLDRLVDKLDLESKVRLLTGATVWRTAAEPAIGLEPMVTSDGPAGVRGEGWDERRTSLSLPSATALAATWDESLAMAIGELLAVEARRKGVHVVLAPTLNLHRSPLGGRHFECYSEDPLLTGRIGAAVIRGIQSRGVAATAKHYVANESETDRLTLDARVDERTLREVYLAPFEAAVQAGVWVVMSAYNGVNGATMSENGLLAEPLKGEWGFDGVVVSDWGAVRSTVASARAAQDLAMPGPEGPWGEALVTAVRAGEVPESAIDDKVRRLLRLAARVGALPRSPAPSVVGLSPGDLSPDGLSPDGLSPDGLSPGGPDDRQDRALLRRTVAASTVLLRNEGDLLPLVPARLTRVAVIGPNAARPRTQGAGSAGVYPESLVTPLEGLRTALNGHAEVRHADGVTFGGAPVPLDSATARNPRTGENGLLVRLLDAAGTEIHAEHRFTGRLLEPGGPIHRAVTVEVRALVRPDRAGLWHVAAAGWGRLELAVDGRIVIDETVPRHTDDPATVHLAPPYRTEGVTLEAGREVEIVMRRELVPGGGRACVLAAAPAAADPAAELAAAVELAGSSDVAVVVVGTTEQAESEGVDRETLTLPEGQDELVRAVAAANPATVVVVNSGGPVAMPWRQEVAAVLVGWFPGEEGGNGLADVLLGRAEPGGRLPTTWADRALVPAVPEHGVLEYAEGPHIGYRGWLREQEPPAYWFGHGLGYTTWRYEGLWAPERIASDRPVRVRVMVRNTGPRAGREVVQIYLSRPRDRARPVRWLAGFAAVTAESGERAEAVVELPARAFQHWAGAWCTAEGEVTVHAGRSAADLPLEAVITVSYS